MPTRRNGGFTLIEIMVVVFILGLLAALVVPRFITQGEKGRVGAARTQIKHLEQAVRMFHLDNSRYPTTAEGLAALIPPPPADLPRYEPGGYLEDGVPLDPWDHPYLYASEGRSFEIISLGRDGAPGGEGYDADLSSRRSNRAPS